MKTLVKALVLVCVGAVAVFFLLKLAGASEEVAKSIAVLVLGSIAYVHKTLAKDQKHVGLSLTPKGIVDREGYKLHWALLTIYSAVIMFMTIELAAALAYFLVNLPAGPERKNTIGLAHLLLTFPMIYFLGRWIGQRADKHLLVATFLFCFLGRSAEAVREYFSMTESQVVTYYGSTPLFFITVGLGTIFAWIIALFGMWRGYRTRLKAYVAYLLKRVPHDSQKTIVDLLYQEAAMQPIK
jgi:hypothetical protein